MALRKTVSPRTMERERVRLLVIGDEGSLPTRPETRGECADVPRPCPFVSCRHHLYLDVNEDSGAIKFNHVGLEPEHLPADRSCALDVADEGGVTLAEAGAALNLTRERARQIEFNAFHAARKAALRGTSALTDFVDDLDPERPPVTSDHAARSAIATVDPFAEFERSAEALPARVISVFDADDDGACTFIWEMFAKRYGIRSRASLAASRALARRDRFLDSEGPNFLGEEQ